MSASQFLSAIYRKERTWNNYRLDVMKSGLQKYIRRGMTDKALYCAGELDLFKYVNDAQGGTSRGEGIRTNFIHRLMVIYLEDVGNLGLWPVIDDHIFAVLNERRSAHRDYMKEEALLVNTVRELCASEKSRACSHVRAVTNVSDPVTRAVLARNASEFPTVQSIHRAAAATAATAATSQFEDLCIAFEAALKERSYNAVTLATKIASAPIENMTTAAYRKKKPVWRVFQILESPA